MRKFREAWLAFGSAVLSVFPLPERFRPPPKLTMQARLEMIGVSHEIAERLQNRIFETGGDEDVERAVCQIIVQGHMTGEDFRHIVETAPRLIHHKYYRQIRSDLVDGTIISSVFFIDAIFEGIEDED